MARSKRENQIKKETSPVMIEPIKSDKNGNEFLEEEK